MVRKLYSRKPNVPSSASTSSRSTIQSRETLNRESRKHQKKTFPEIFPEAFSDSDEAEEAPRSPRIRKPFRLAKKKKTGGLHYRGKPMELWSANKPRFQSPQAEQDRNNRQKTKKKSKQPPAEPETMETVRNFLDWTRAERARHPIGIPLKTVVVNRKATPYQDITSFDSDLVMRHVKICDHYNYNCNVCNVARRRQEIGKTNRDYIGEGRMGPNEPCTCERETQSSSQATADSPCPPTPDSSIYRYDQRERVPEPSESEQGTSKSTPSTVSTDEEKFIGKLKGLQVAGPSGLNKNQSTPDQRKSMILPRSRLFKPIQGPVLRRRFTMNDFRESSESD